MLLASDRYRDYLAIIRRRAVFEIARYDDPESIELVEHWLKFGDGKKLKVGTHETWAKLRYDRQIAAIAVTRRVECIYSTEADLEKYADELGIKYRNLSHLALPPSEQQELHRQEVQPEPIKTASAREQRTDYTGNGQRTRTAQGRSSDTIQPANRCFRLNAVSEDGQSVPCRDRRPQGRDRSARGGMAEAKRQEAEERAKPIATTLRES